MPNHLARETSPYLLQHAGNPVDWYAWGPDALAKARTDDMPILLSIGYAACHWCHVMAHESFEDPATARLMNERFVNVKVDREERPDLDAIYMQAVQAMTGQGGWPMTVFLTPSGEPFYGGTYFPPDDRHGLPSFRRVLLSVSDAWRSKRDDVSRAVASLLEIYAPKPATGDGAPISAGTLEAAYRDIARRFEPLAGGFGRAPKFPQAMTLDFVLRRWARTGDQRALHIVSHSFRSMMRGGIYDQVGGGFHRYTVDAHWVVPHFEKMLYDNALLARLGVHLWQATGDDDVRQAAEETLGWVIREMTDAGGGWYSSLDADSEGEEGKFYVWTLDELRRELGDDSAWAIQHFGATAGGNFEGKNILTRARAEPAAGTVLPAVDRARVVRVLYEGRAKRVWPGRDEKILASWNGLMLRAMSEAALVFHSVPFREAALANGAFLWREMVRDGRASRTHTRGETRISGFLEDHAALALGFLSLYALTFDRMWFDRARALADTCTSCFWSDTFGAFYDTAADHEALITRPRDVTDNATPAGTSLTVELLLIIAELTGDAEARRRADHVLGTLGGPMQQYGTMFGHLLGAADLAVNGAVEVAIAGDPATSDFAALLRVVASCYLPSLVIAGGMGDAVRGLVLMDGREPVDATATAYVCRHYACELPATDPIALAAQLANASQVRA
ncbi:MAG TPA: thioredoxin domain-containing protein [Gemmatimonadaceae bacterium]|nr:thioredoxin domain-containing protein [Gemmatimonadaceae bacterium]